MSLLDVAQRARHASNALNAASTDAKNAALEAVRQELLRSRADVEAANRRDKQAAEKNGLSAALSARLNVEGDKYATLLQGLEDVIRVTDPVGEATLARQLDDGLELYRVSCPIGVLCIIFESRPEAAVQISSLAIKSSNAVILKGGKEALESNRALVKAFQIGLKKAGLPEDAVQLVSTREDISALLKLDQYIDLVIPRGSNALVRNVMDNTRIPVMGHADGICSVYVDAGADLEKAVKLVVDSKTQYVAACNTAETLLIHDSVVETMLPVIAQGLADANVKLHAESSLLPFCPEASSVAATEKDFRTEYLALEMAVKAVPSVEAAIEHINTNGSHHTDCIITEDGKAAEKFLEGVASAGVYHNASTRFADGFRYGFGAEVGVSTNRIHARGPVGLEGLLTYKYRLHGDGHCVADYGQAKKQYTHVTRKLVGDNPRAPNLARGEKTIENKEKQLVQASLCVAGLAAAAFLVLRMLRPAEN